MSTWLTAKIKKPGAALPPSHPPGLDASSGQKFIGTGKLKLNQEDGITLYNGLRQKQSSGTCEKHLPSG